MTALGRLREFRERAQSTRAAIEPRSRGHSPATEVVRFAAVPGSAEHVWSLDPHHWLVCPIQSLSGPIHSGIGWKNAPCPLPVEIETSLNDVR